MLAIGYILSYLSHIVIASTRTCYAGPTQEQVNASPNLLRDGAIILDPFLIPHLTPKLRRICANSLCAKPLSLLNKQELCYTCYNQALFRRSELTSHRPSASKFLR